MNVDQDIWTFDKVFWAQEEVLIGTMFVIEHTGAQWARGLFDRTLEYVEANSRWRNTDLRSGSTRVTAPWPSKSS